MAKGQKKRNIWKIGFLVLAALIVIFLLWAFLSDDEEDYYEENYYEEAERTEKTQLSNTVGGYTGESNSELLQSAAVREKKVKLKGNGKDKVTVLVYMNGSNLETEDSEATTDLSEMIAAGYGDNVNVIVQTMNTKKWDKKLGISNARTQRYELSGNGITLVQDNLGQLNCSETSTLRDFVMWGAKTYPADRYILLFWNHGGGPVYGFGYDDLTESEDSLSIDEMQKALKDAGVYFDFIGMDCCLMSTLEVCCALNEFCDYMILSEDFESGLGWSYTNWLSKLYKNSSIPTHDLGKIIIDDMVSTNANDTQGWGDDSIMALVDMSMMKVMYQSWVDFAYANETALLGNNYSRKKSRPRNGRVHPAIASKGIFSDWLGDDESDEEDPLMSDYYVTDIMALASSLNSKESNALASAVSNTLVYVNSCGDDTSLTGISVTLPYGDSDFYKSLTTVFSNCGFDSKYIDWLSTFVSAKGSDEYYDYDSWDESWDGWDEYEDDFDWGDWWDDCDYDDDYWEDGDFWGWLFDFDDYDDYDDYGYYDDYDDYDDYDYHW